MMFTFPGQGSQVAGMGRNLNDNFPIARETFEEVDDVLGFSLSKIMFEEQNGLLTATENAQPALLAVSMAALKVFLSETKKNIEYFATYVCGHSVGEYSAICAAGGLSLADSIKLVRQRGLAMRDAAQNIQGGMVAVIKSDINTIESIIASIEGFCEIANDNSSDQIVISGSNESLEKFIEIGKKQGIKRMVRLQVSAPFHSSLMQPVASVMQKALSEVQVFTLKIPVISNVNALPTQNSQLVKDLLVKQVVGRVRWRETMLFAQQNNIKNYVEFGSEKVLSNLVKKMDENAIVHNVHEAEDIKKLVDYLALSK